MKTKPMNLQNSFIIDGDKLDIDKRISELSKPIAHYDGIYVSDIQRAEIELLEELKAHLTPAIEVIKPLVEDAFNDSQDGIECFEGILKYQNF